MDEVPFFILASLGLAAGASEQIAIETLEKITDQVFGVYHEKDHHTYDWRIVDNYLIKDAEDHVIELHIRCDIFFPGSIQKTMNSHAFPICYSPFPC